MKKEAGGLPIPSLSAIVKNSVWLAVMLILLSQTAFSVSMKKYSASDMQFDKFPEKGMLEEVNMSSMAKNRALQSGLFASFEKMTYCSETGECETQVFMENEAGDIPGMTVDVEYGFDSVVKDVSLWQSYVSSTSTELEQGQIKLKKNYRWAPLDVNSFTFMERTNQSLLLKYSVAPCTNGTWSLAVYSPFGPMSASGKYASVCPASPGPTMTPNPINAGESWETVLNPGGSKSTVLYASKLNYWDGGAYKPINKTVKEMSAWKSEYSLDYRFEFGTGSYPAYFKPDINSDWPVLAGNGEGILRMKPFGIAYLEGGRYRYIQLAASSVGIPNGNAITYKNVYTGVDIIYYYEEDELKEKIILKDEFRSMLSGPSFSPDSEIYFVSSVDYGSLDSKVESEPLLFGENTSGRIDFFGKGGAKAFSFLPASAKDSSKALVDGKEVSYPDEKNMPAVITESSGKKFYAATLPISWLRRSVYPIEIDPTVQISGATTGNCLEWVNTYEWLSGYYNRSIQLKFNITSIDATSNISDVTFCGYVESVTGSPDTDVNFSRVNNQTWTNPSAAQYNAHAITDVNTSQAWSSNTASTWHCVNVTQQFLSDFNARNVNFSLRFEDLDFPVINKANLLDGGGNLGKEGSGSDAYRTFTACAGTAAQRPYLNVTTPNSTCGTIVNNTVLGNNVTATGATCMTIGADNITLNCAGYTITGDLTANVYGVLASGRKNITIKNCRITNFTTAISFVLTNNSFIYNTTIYNTTGANGANGANRAGTLSCAGPYIGGSAVEIYGVYLQDSSNNTLANNTVSNLTAGNGGRGGSKTGGTSNFNGCNGGNGGTLYGVYFYSNSRNNSLSNNTLTRLTGGRGGNGGAAYSAGTGGNGGAAGGSYGFYASDSGSMNNSILLAVVSSLVAGNGGAGGASANIIGTAASGAVAAGAYILSANNTFTGSVYNLTGGAGGGGGTSTAFLEGTGGDGGAGGPAYSIYINAANGNETVANATLANLTAGDGGAGGDGLSDGYGGSGGSGGSATILYANSAQNSLNNCTLSNSSRGNGGAGGAGTYGDGAIGTAGSGYGIYFNTTSAFSNSIINSTISQTGNWDVYSQTSPQNNTLLGTNLDKAKVGFGTCTTPCNLTVQWYLAVNVTNDSGAVNGASVNVTDLRRNQRMSGWTTASNGLTNYAIATEMIMNKTSTVLQNYTFNNHVINGSSSGQFNSASFNVTSTTVYNLQIGTCRSIGSSTTLTGNVITAYTCFTIAANNINFDCNGYTITGPNSRYVYAFDIEGMNNITIKNCRIANFSRSIVANNSQNITLQNNTVYNSYLLASSFVDDAIGVYIRNTSIVNITNHTDWNITVNNNNQQAMGGYSYGIYVTTSNLLTITNYTGENHTGSRSLWDGDTAWYTVTTGYGLYLSSISNSSLNRITIKNMSGGYGVDVVTTCFSNVSLQSVNVNNTYYGVYLACPANITGVWVDQYEYYGIILSSNSNLTNFNITNGANYYGLQLSSSDSNIQNGRITNSSTAIYFSGHDMGRNVFQNITINNASTVGINLMGSTGSPAWNENNSFNNITIDNSTAGIVFRDSKGTNITDGRIYDYPWMSYSIKNNAGFFGSFNNTFLNTTANYSRLSSSGSWDFAVKWYVRARVVDSFGSPLQNAYVNISDNVNRLSFNNVQTDANGYTGWVVVNDTNYTDTGNTTFNNHTFNASSGALSSTVSYNLTGSWTINMTLGSVCANISADTALLTGVPSTGTCFNFTSNNITLDCGGYSITGNQSLNAFAILASGRTNITIKNCLISNYTDAINFTGTNHSFIYNTTIYNTSGVNGAAGTTGATCTHGGAGYTLYGITFSNSINNTLSNNTITNLTGGTGGAGGSPTSGNTGCNGSYGGSVYGVYFASNSLNNSFSNNTITVLTAGNGGGGGNSKLATSGAGGNGSYGGQSYGLYISDAGSTKNTILTTTVSRITSGSGGNGGKGGTIAGTGGNGGYGGNARGEGIYSANNTITGGAFNITAGNGGAGGGTRDLSAGNGGNGGDGGAVYSIFISATNSRGTVENMTIGNVTAGNGGNGGDGGPDTGEGGCGGNGGSATILYANSAQNSLNNCTLSNSTKGTAGSPGTGGTKCVTGASGTGYGIYFTSTSAYGNNVTNSSIAQTGTYDVYSTTSPQNNTFLNVSFDLGKVGFGACIAPCNLTVQWYVRVNATDNTGTAITGAIVNITDVQNNIKVLDNVTDSNGLINFTIIDEMIMNKTVTTVENYTFNNHTINVSYGNGFNSTSKNITGSWTINVTIYPAAASLSFTITLPSSGCREGEGCTTPSCEACTRAWIETTDLTGAANQMCVQPQGQDDASLTPDYIPFLNFTNTGSVNLEWTIKLNASFAGTYELNITGDNTGTHPDCASSSEITTSFGTVGSGIAPGSSYYGWLWGEFINALYGNETQNLNHTSVAS